MHLAFDLDGVLLDSETDRGWLDRALAAALEELGLDPSDGVLAELYPPSVDRIEAVAGELGVPAERLWRVRNAHYVRGKLAAIESGALEPFADVDALYELAADHQLHVISNSPGRVVEAFVDTYGYDDLFEVCIGRGEELEDLERLKPDPYLYHRLLDRLEGTAPDVYVGDTETDRAFARATEMRFVHLTRDERGVRTLRSLRDRLG
jgi:phosphoglycolate phosphatase